MKYPVSNTQLQMIVGGLLGDSHIRRKEYNGKRCNAHIMIAHGEHQKEYLKWKMELLEDLFNGKITASANTGYGKGNLRYSAESKSSEKLNPFWELFGKPKRVSRKALNLLDPLGLAIWYMDDGTLNIEYFPRQGGGYGIRRRRIALATDCFSFKEHCIMQQYFRKVWNIETKIQKVRSFTRGKEYYRLLMNYTEAQKFVDIIKPHIHPSMMYKIDFNRERNCHNVSTQHKE